MSNQSKSIGLPLKVDRDNKTDYYATRANLTACFETGLLNKDHLHVTINDNKGWKLDVSGNGFIETALIGGETVTHIDNIFPGARLFQLKATHGVPLEISLENLTRRSMVVDWTGFIEEARLSGWYDFQTLEVIQNALADVFDRDVQEAIILRIKRFILNHPLVA